VEENNNAAWGPHPHRVSVKFVDVAEPVREKLIQYIFRVQREAIRRVRAQNDPSGPPR
jgi:c-di-GMP-binding flagellar brake protein YcgR